jgi:hypothetical protein
MGLSGRRVDRQSGLRPRCNIFGSHSLPLKKRRPTS